MLLSWAVTDKPSFLLMSNVTLRVSLMHLLRVVFLAFSRVLLHSCTRRTSACSLVVLQYNDVTDRYMEPYLLPEILNKQRKKLEKENLVLKYTEPPNAFKKKKNASKDFKDQLKICSSKPKKHC